MNEYDISKNPWPYNIRFVVLLFGYGEVPNYVLDMIVERQRDNDEVKDGIR